MADENTSPMRDLPNTVAFDEHVAVLSDIRVAEDQIARGEWIEHEDAKQQVLARFGQ